MLVRANSGNGVAAVRRAFDVAVTSPENTKHYQEPISSSERLRISVLKAIRNGDMPVGSKMPSIRAFAKEFGMPLPTVQKVFDQLRASGWLVAAHGSGTYVSKLSNRLIEQTKVESQNAFQAQARNKEYSPWQYNLPLLDLSVSKHALAESNLDDGQAAIDSGHHFYSPKLKWQNAIKKWTNRDFAEMNGVCHQDLSPLLEKIAAWLGASRGIKCSPKNVFIMRGAEEARFTLARLLVDVGSPIVIEDPHSIVLRSLLETFGASLIPLPLSVDGYSKWAFSQVGKAEIIWTTPTAQFPTGANFSLEGREQILAWRKERDAIIVEDESCCPFIYDGVAQPSLYSLDSSQRTIYLGRFDHLVPQGFRFAVLVAPDFLVSKLNALRQRERSFVSPLVQTLLIDLIDEGFLRERSRLLQRKLDANRNALAACFAKLSCKQFSMRPLSSGIYQPFYFSRKISDLKLQEVCAKEGKDILPISPYFLGTSARSGWLINLLNTSEPSMQNNLERMNTIMTTLAEDWRL